LKGVLKKRVQFSEENENLKDKLYKDLNLTYHDKDDHPFKEISAISNTRYIKPLTQTEVEED
jgi:hypothetical protein